MALQGNPWKCVCQNTWLAKWLLRWMRETLQLHTSVVERGRNIQSIVRTITCQIPIDAQMSTAEEGRVAAASSTSGGGLVQDAAGDLKQTQNSAVNLASILQHGQQSLVDINPDNTCLRHTRSSRASTTVTLTPVTAVLPTLMVLRRTLSIL